MSIRKRLYFTKMHGAGNDYVYVDALGSPTSLNIKETDLPDLSRKISDRHFGVGGDGLIAILPSLNADFRMRMFNADGSEAQMCGNGTRCVGKYVFEKGFTDKTTVTLETLAGVKTLLLHLDNGRNVESVTVDMGKAIFDSNRIPVVAKTDTGSILMDVCAGGKNFEVSAVGMGNPHGVIFVDEITDELVHHYGPLLEKHPMWPEKANIEFAKILSPTHIEMRVWERGSGETLACGTGACATHVAAVRLGLASPEAKLSLLGGDLTIKYNEADGHVYMNGPAEFVADGIYYYQ